MVRTTEGQTLTRVSPAQRGSPPSSPPVVVSPPQNDVLRYGPSYR